MAKYNQVLRVERGLAEVVQKPFPEVGEGFVLVEIEVAPVCTEQKPYSTGFLEWYERNDCLGHEGVGVVVGIGKGVEGIREGARVIVYQGWPCGRCWVCRSRLGPTHCVNFRGFREIEAHNHSQSGGGGFSRFRLAPASMIQAIPDGLSWRHAAGANCLIGCTFTAVREAAVGPGDFCLVSGVGFIGHATIANLKALGCNVIALGRNPVRLEKAQELGADRVINPEDPTWLEQVRDFTPDRAGVAAAFECSGYPYYQQRSLSACRPYGKLVLLGYAAQESDMKWSIHTETEICWQHKSITASFDVRFQDRDALLAHLQTPTIGAAMNSMVTHEIPMSRAAEAFDTILAGDACKVHLLPKL